MSTARTLPLWGSLAHLSQKYFQEISEPGEADVVIIGAGIAGLATAIALLEDGRRVTMVDREGFGEGESLRTTAHLASALDDRFANLQRWHGSEGARLAADSHAAAIDWLEQVCALSHAISFQRVTGYLFAHDGAIERLQDEARAAREAGLDARLKAAGLPDWPQLGPVLEFPDQARVDMQELIQLLARRAADLGSRFVRADAQGVSGGNRVTVALSNGISLTAAAAVIATNVPFHERFALHTKQAPYRSYVVAAPCEAGDIPDALVWDDADPYHYVRWVANLQQPGTGWALIGGEDHKTGQDDDPEAYVRLQAWARERFPRLQRFTHAWSGQILEPADGLAFIGADPGGEKNVFVITGDSGNGVTHGALGGLLLRDLIQGRDHPWAKLYDPCRKPLKAGTAWLKENANVAAQYSDWVNPADATTPAALSRGEGAVLRRGLHRVAVYRDAGGELHAFSARCPHLGCVVRWSPQEKSWDCPCHGSRFGARDGQVLNGPAHQPLSPFDLEPES